MLQMFSYL